MSKPLPAQVSFAPLSPPWSLVSLDSNFTSVYAAINDIGTYANTLTDTGAVNALTVTPAAGVTFTLVTGIAIDVIVGNTNTTTTPTLNANATGAKTIVNADGSALLVGALVATGIYRFTYDGTNYRVANPSAISLGSLTLATPLAIASGGTAASTAANARSNLGVTATGADTTYAFRANNLSDLGNAATARTNLGVTATNVSGTGTAALSCAGIAIGQTFVGYRSANSATISSNTTLTIDSVVQLTNIPIGTYLITGQVNFQASGNASGCNWGVAATGATIATAAVWANGTNTTQASLSYTNSSFTSNLFFSDGTATQTFGGSLIGCFTTNATTTAGVFWSQHLSSAQTLYLGANSYIQVTRIA